MKLKRIKTTFYATTLLLALIGGNTVYTASKGVYATYKRGAEEQQTATYAQPLPNFMIQSPKREEYAMFWNKLDKEIDRQEENRRVR